MRKVFTYLIGTLLLMSTLCLCVACSGDSSKFIGIWDLRSVSSSNGGAALTEEQVTSMRDLGLSAYLNVEEDGSLTLVNYDKALYGKWKVTGEAKANATIDGQSAQITVENDTLKLIQRDTTLVFFRGDAEDEADADARVEAKDDAANKGSETVSPQRQTTGLSEMIVRGALYDTPIVLVDDDICQILVSGVGVDKWGDPGYNIQITNKQHTSIDVWIKDTFVVNDKRVRVYLFETVPSNKSIVSFMQFDTDDLGSTSTTALEQVSGVILVDNNQNVTIGRYAVTL